MADTDDSNKSMLPVDPSIERKEEDSNSDGDVIANEEVTRALRGIIRQEIRVSTFFAGPLPPPEILAGYQKIDPSFPDTIMRRAGSEQDHRHMMDRKFLDAQIRQSEIGQRLGAILGFFVVIAITLIGIFGHPIAGPAAAGVIGVAFTGLMGYVYVQARKQKKSSSESFQGHEVVEQGGRRESDD